MVILQKKEIANVKLLIWNKQFYCISSGACINIVSMCVYIFSNFFFFKSRRNTYGYYNLRYGHHMTTPPPSWLPDNYEISK